MAATDVKILGGWASPFAMRPRIALNLKNVDYEFIAETMAPKSELLLKMNPIHQKIPVMIHHDKPICESLIIVQYIDETFTSGSCILPSSSYDRAIARFWASYVDDKWFGMMRGVTAAKSAEDKKAAIAGVAAGTALLEEAFQKISQGKGFFGGETIGYIDIALGSCLGWVRVTETLSGAKIIDEATAPGLYGWAERFCADAAVRELMPDTEKLVEFAKMIFAKYAAAAAAAAGSK